MRLGQKREDIDVMLRISGRTSQASIKEIAKRLKSKHGCKKETTLTVNCYYAEYLNVLSPFAFESSSFFTLSNMIFRLYFKTFTDLKEIIWLDANNTRKDCRTLFK